MTFDEYISDGWENTMTFDEYQEKARRTQSPGMPNSDRLFHAIFGLASEAGEAAGLMQKRYQGHDLDKNHMVRELGDCMWFIAEACDAIGVTMEQVGKANILKLIVRYPDGFEPEKSLHRKKGDI